MTTLEIIKQMEKEFDEKLAELKCADYSTEEVVDFGFRYKIGDEIGKAVDWAYIKSFIHSYIRTLLESFGEEIIGEDDSEEDDYPEYTNISQADFNAERNSLRDEQRLKAKEIISSIK